MRKCYKKVIGVISVLSLIVTCTPLVASATEVNNDEYTVYDSGSKYSENITYEADYSKFEKLIDTINKETSQTLFGKRLDEWTLQDATEYVNLHIPNMNKTTRTNPIIWKSGEPPAAQETTSYEGHNGNYDGAITLIKTTLANGSVAETNEALYYYIGGTGLRSAESITFSGSLDIYNGTIENTRLEQDNLTSYLELVDDDEITNFMNNETELNKKIIYNLSNGDKIVFIANEERGAEHIITNKTPRINYVHNNHTRTLSFESRALINVEYSTRYTPINMYRLYNPYSGEHFYTKDENEVSYLSESGWNNEGLAWKAPAMSDTPVYRLFNSASGEHHYTTNEGEKDYLVSGGWSYEGVGWYSFERKTSSLYRLFNPNATGVGAHHYTTDAGERDFLIASGWIDEGIGWFGM